MKEIIEYSRDDIIPSRKAILMSQGIPAGKQLHEKINGLIDEAVEIFRQLCQPTGIISELSTTQFETIYEGEGLNESATPVVQIFPKADHLALFAVTVGEEVSDNISQLFESNDFALASVLDSVASEATEKAGIITEKHYFDYLLSQGGTSPESAVGRYSPGYCGWHISGQKKLFEFLCPEEIGITLNDSFLMNPLKSISGVMIVGRKEIHLFDISYSFCDECIDQGCRERMRAIAGE